MWQYPAKPAPARPVRRLALALASLLALLGLPQPSAAEDAWLVSEVAIGEPSGESLRIVRETERALRQRGLKVVSSADAGPAFERSQSRAAYTPKPGELDALEQLTRRLSDAVAADDTAEVQSLLSDLERRPADAQDLLNRDMLRARRRLQACLLAAQLFDRQGEERAAQEQLSSCARDFPGLPLEAASSAPDGMLEFLARARRSFAASPTTSLRVEVEPTRDKSRCFVRVNGVARGTAPSSVEGLRTPRVRVQVECGNNPSRIYDQPTSDAVSTLHIDPKLDAAVFTQPGLGLRYADAASADALRLKHGVVLAEAAGARNLLQLFRGKLRRVDVASGRELASDLVGSGPQLSAALDFVLSNGQNAPPARAAQEPRRPAPAAEPDLGATRSDNIPSARESVSESHPETGAPERQPAPYYRGPPARPFRTLGYVAAGLTVAAAATAIIFWRIHEGHISKFNERPECTDADPGEVVPNCQQQLNAADTAGSILLVSAISGGTALVLTGTFLIIDANRPRERDRDLSCGPGPGIVGVSCGLRF